MSGDGPVMDTEAMEKKANVFPRGQTKITLLWNIHIACNYRCSYCTFTLGLWGGKKWTDHAENNRYPAYEDLIALWDRLYEQCGSVYIEIDTGEPTTYPRFIDLAAEITKKHSISITSNLAQGMDFWRAYAEKVKNCVITTSFHPQFAKTEEYIEKVLFLQKYFSIKVVCVAWPPHVSRLLGYKKLFKEKGISFRAQAYWGPYAGVNYPDSYTEEQQGIIRQCSEDLEGIFKAQLQYQLYAKETLGRPCRSGQVFGIIMNDGNVYRCSSVRTESLGNIYDGTFRMLEEPRPCPVKSCLCEWKFLADLSPEEAKAVAGDV